MQGKQQIKLEIAHIFKLEEMIPNNHILRKINKIVDLSFIRKITEPYYCANNGRPSIDPELFFRMIIIGYLYGISSDRKLCEEIYFNIAYRWFCKLSLTDKVPNHSSLTRIRDRLGVAIFREIFLNIILECQKMGLIKGEHVMTDGTLFQANAALDSMTIRNEKTNNNDLKKDKVIPGIIPPKGKKITNETHISRTDPDASLAFKKGTIRSLKYKNHLTIDADNRVILDSKITTGSTHESQIYLDRINTITKDLSLKIQVAIADRAYGSGHIIQGLLDKDIEPNIPLFSGRSGKRELEQEGFFYDKQNNHYRCKNGKILAQYPTIVQNNVRFHTKAGDCNGCKMQSNCTARKKGNTSIRLIDRPFYQELFDKIKEKMTTNSFRKNLSERMWKLEGLMSEIKLRHNMNRAKYRGIDKVQMQAYMAAYIINLKRLIAHIFLHYFIVWVIKRHSKLSYLTVKLGVFQQAR